MSVVDAIDTRVNAHIEAFANCLYTALPGRVESYNAKTQTASIYPAVDVYEKDFSSTPYSIITDVPVCILGTPDSVISVPIKKGTSGLIVWSQRSIDNWQAQSGVGNVAPESFRKHDLTDAFFIPGAWPSKANPVKKITIGNPSEDVIVTNGLGGSNSSVVLKKNGEILIKNAGGTLTIPASGATTLQGTTFSATHTSHTLTGLVNLVGATAVTGPLTVSGNFGVNGAAAVSPPTLPADATNDATCYALANAIKDLLIDYGLAN